MKSASGTALRDRIGGQSMTDVFISYASEDRKQALALANALGACGWSIWWDRKIIAGQTFDQAIERELEMARSVVVLWSKASIASEWVKNEAAAAAERGVLIPALIENVRLPLEFRRKQTADLIGWDGSRSHSGFQALCDGIVSTIDSPGPRPSPPTPPGMPGPVWDRRWTIAVMVLVAILLVFAAYSTGLWPTAPPSPAREVAGIPSPGGTATPQSKVPPDPPAPPAGGASTPAAARTAVVEDLDGFVNVRSGPGTNFSIVGRVNSGETVQLRELDGAWWLVDAPIGRGFVHQSRLVPGK
jgi:hypothetical protein